MSWRTNQHCKTEYGEHRLRICNDVFLLTLLVIVADEDSVYPIGIFR